MFSTTCFYTLTHLSKQFWFGLRKNKTILQPNNVQFEKRIQYYF